MKNKKQHLKDQLNNHKKERKKKKTCRHKQILKLIRKQNKDVYDAKKSIKHIRENDNAAQGFI